MLETYRKQFLEIGVTEDEAMLHALIKEQNRLLIAARALKPRINFYEQRVLEAARGNKSERRRMTETRRQKLMADFRGLMASGLDVSAAARALGIHQLTAQSWLSNRRPRITKRERYELLPKLSDLLAQGYDIPAASKELGISIVTAYKWRRNYLTPALAEQARDAEDRAKVIPSGEGVP